MFVISDIKRIIFAGSALVSTVTDQCGDLRPPSVGIGASDGSTNFVTLVEGPVKCLLKCESYKYKPEWIFLLVMILYIKMSKNS